MLHGAIRQTLFQQNALKGIRQSLTMSNFPDIQYSMYNTRAKTNDTGSTRPVPLSMNKLTAEYWNSYVI